MVNIVSKVLDRLVQIQQKSVFKVLSFVLSAVVMMLILFWPKFVMAADGSVDHGYLTSLLLCNSFGFVHGIGYLPVNKIWRWLMTPIIAWPLQLHFLYGLAL